jgi:hypothetical protein
MNVNKQCGHFAHTHNAYFHTCRPPALLLGQPRRGGGARRQTDKESAAGDEVLRAIKGDTI